MAGMLRPGLSLSGTLVTDAQPLQLTHVPCHVLSVTCMCEPGSGELKVTHSPLSNRPQLSEADFFFFFFLQFDPTSLLNHLHYLTAFSQREL